MKDAESLLKSVANGKRIAILRLLLYEGEKPVSVIAQRIKLSFKGTSKHLLRLERAGFIARRQKSFWGYYSINEHMARKNRLLLKFLKNNFFSRKA